MKPTKSQQQAIDSNSEDILVIAGAGSGKTATVISRITRLIREGTRPDSILCLTFTKKAALEIKARLAKNVSASAAKKVWVGTFHSISYRMLSQWGSKIGYQTNNGKSITVITPDETEMLLKEIKETYQYKGSQKSINKAKSVLAHDGTLPEDPDLLRIIKEYHAKLKECNAVDFDQLLLEVQRLFEVYPEALEYYQARFDHVFVDEYQDTDKVQYSLHELLKPKHLFCVGDSDQAIYSWRGANIGIILGFEEDHENAEVIKLEECFRCGDEIVEKSNNLIAHNETRIEKTLIGATGRDGVFELDTRCEADEIAFYMSEYMAFENPAEIAVIARTHRTLEKIEKACDALNLEVLRVGKETQVVESFPEFQLMKACLRLDVNPADNIAFLTANKLFFHEDLKEVWRIANKNGCSWFEALKSMEEKVNVFPFHSGEAPTITLYFEELTTYLLDYTSFCDANCQKIEAYLLKHFEDVPAVDWLKAYQLRDSQLELQKHNDKITLITAHAAKGLEWDNVLVADFNEGKFPSKAAVNAGNIEEERRLAYVAFTRARERLIVFSSQAKPSRFVSEAGYLNNVVETKVPVSEQIEKQSDLGNKIAIVDIETGGFKTSDPVVEIGIATLNLDNGDTEVIYNELVKENSLQDHHKKSWVFLHSDLSFENVIAANPLNVEAIQEIADKYQMTAFNKSFDFRFLRARGIEINELPCPMHLSTNICKIRGKLNRFKLPSVEEAWKFFFPKTPYIEKHRGADDAVHEAKIVYALYRLGVFKVPNVLTGKVAA